MQHPLIQLLAAHAGGSQRSPQDVLPVPKEHVFEFLRLVQHVHDVQNGNEPDAVAYNPAFADEGPTAARWRLWSFTNEIMPYCVGKDCAINTGNSTKPVVNVYGPAKLPVVGKKGVRAVVPFPAEHRFELFDLMDHDGHGPLHSYRLWTFIHAKLPEVQTDLDGGTWHIHTEPPDILLVLTIKEE
jgi:hypothetical protein